MEKVPLTQNKAREHDHLANKLTSIPIIHRLRKKYLHRALDAVLTIKLQRAGNQVCRHYTVSDSPLDATHNRNRIKRTKRI